MQFIGDVHGQIDKYRALLKDEPSIQVGDIGIGIQTTHLPELDKRHRFIRGNHDSPDLCKRHLNYLGDWGYLRNENIFYVSGAISVDQDGRAPGIDWWADEQLSTEELVKAVQDFRASKPKIVVSHDCPWEPRHIIMPGNFFRTRTDFYLQQMLDEHRPDVWIFGHHHIKWRQTIKGCDFICLNVLESISI
jgi:predicted phosphodiesterase